MSFKKSVHFSMEQSLYSMHIFLLPCFINLLYLLQVLFHLHLFLFHLHPLFIMGAQIFNLFSSFPTSILRSMIALRILFVSIILLQSLLLLLFIVFLKHFVFLLLHHEYLFFIHIFSNYSAGVLVIPLTFDIFVFRFLLRFDEFIHRFIDVSVLFFDPVSD